MNQESIHINGCRCNERLITKTEGSKLLGWKTTKNLSVHDREDVGEGRVWDFKFFIIMNVGSCCLL